MPSLLNPMGPSNDCGGAGEQPCQQSALAGWVFPPKGWCRGPGRSRLFPPPSPPAAPQAGPVLLAGLIFCNAPPCYKCVTSGCPARGWRHSPGQRRSHVLPAAAAPRTAVPRAVLHPFLLLLRAAATSQQLPGSPAASKHMPPSRPSRASSWRAARGDFRHPALRGSSDFRARAGSPLPCGCLPGELAGEGFVRAGLGETGSP